MCIVQEAGTFISMYQKQVDFKMLDSENRESYKTMWLEKVPR